MSDPIQQARLFSAAMQGNMPVQGVQKKVAVQTQDQLRKACSDFESIFIQQMMQQMRQTVPQDGLFSGGQAEQMYTSMLDGELSKTFTQDGRGLGLAQVLYRQLSTLQDGGDGKEPESASGLIQERPLKLSK